MTLLGYGGPKHETRLYRSSRRRWSTQDVSKLYANDHSCCSTPTGRGTHIDNTLNLPKYGSDGLTNNWYGLEQTGLSDQDVQKSLVDSHEL